MGKTIKMIPTSEDNCLFLYGANSKGELIFRTSRNIKHLQTEVPLIEKEICRVGLYYFHVNYLADLIIVE